MKIVLDLPEWVGGRHIYVFAGIELAAYKPVNGEWLVKESRCSRCGVCCEECEHLIPDGPLLVCSLGIKRPFTCCMTGGATEGCTERYGRL